MNSELVAVEVVKELMNEVEIMARTVESVGKASNGEEGVKIPIHPSLNDGELSFQDSGDELEEVFEKENDEENSMTMEEDNMEEDKELREEVGVGAGGAEMGIEEGAVRDEKESGKESESGCHDIESGLS